MLSVSKRFLVSCGEFSSDLEGEEFAPRFSAEMQLGLRALALCVHKGEGVRDYIVRET